MALRPKSNGLVAAEATVARMGAGRRDFPNTRLWAQGPLLAVAFVLAYVLRASLLYCVPNSQFVEFLTHSTIATLLLAGTYLIVGGVAQINRWGVLVIALTGASLWNCERFEFASLRWIGWAILLWALGPVNSTIVARRFRHHMRVAINHAFLAATILSALWWVAGLPNLGRGDFTGVMSHSMVLGPIAAYVGILALVRVSTQGSPVWLVVYAISGIVVMLASSRAALVAMAIGSLLVFVLRLKRHPTISSLVLASALMLVMSPASSLSFMSHLLPEGFTSGLAEKSWNNSREYHWEARWDEFLSSPINGVGFASGWEDTIGVDEETGTVESGSSYLAILSMTGCVGFAGCAALATAMAGRVFARWPALSEQQRIEICSVAGFWAVHLGAEGYIYAVGSLMGFAFWLWMGCLHDQLLELPSKATTRPTRAQGLACRFKPCFPVSRLQRETDQQGVAG